MSFVSDSAPAELYVRLFGADAIELAPYDWNSRNVQDRFWRLYRNATAGASLELAGGSYELRAGRVYLVPTKVLFSCCNRQAMRHFYAHFDVLGASPRALHSLFDGPLCLNDSALLEAQADALFEELAAGALLDEARRCRAKALVYQGIARYFELAPPAKLEAFRRFSTAQAPVAAALEHIEENLAQPQCNAQLAALCGYAEDHFIRCFATCLGTTPARYVQERRVTVAAQKLLFSAQSIEAIAQNTGFTNRFYFSRVFKNHTGFSPAAYRNSARV